MERNENARRVENAVREQRLCTADKLQRPLGPEYNPSGTRLRLWAPRRRRYRSTSYRRGRRRGLHGDLPLEQHGQGVWSVYLPGDQHGHYYTFTVEVDGTAYETGDPYARTQASTACGA